MTRNVPRKKPRNREARRFARSARSNCPRPRTRARVSTVSSLARCAEKGDQDAQYLMGMAFDKGDGVEVDLEKAARWFSLAAEQGQPFAEYRLGFAYQFGRGVMQSLSSAIAWYRKSAEHHNPEAYFALHNLYSRGIGVDVDAKLAHRYLCDAASRGHVVAHIKLAAMDLLASAIREGDDVDDLIESMDQENAEALLSVAVLMLYGRVPARKPQHAMQLLARSAKAGCAKAAVAIRLLGVAAKAAGDPAEVDMVLRQAAVFGSRRAIAFLAGNVQPADEKDLTPQGRIWATALRSDLDKAEKFVGELRSIIDQGIGLLDEKEIGKVRELIASYGYPVLF